jgi:thiosulfate/3-mercaptopyruvate sulfurtransferase
VIDASNPKGYANPHLLVEPAALAAQLRASTSHGRPLILDVRPAHAFAAGHLPGAVHVDLWGVSLIDTDPAPLRAFLWMIHHVLVLRGVDTTHEIVVCDQQSGLRAARAFWFLEYFGHERVRVLDGGVDAWTREGHALTTECVEPVSSQWAQGAKPSILASWTDVRDRLGEGAVMLDTRTAEEHTGTAVRARRGGAIPGSVHVEWTRNLDERGAFKRASSLRDMYAAAGVTPDREVVTYCQGAYRAAHSYLALRLLGYPRVRVYLGSWKEWGDRDDTPIEIPRG